MSADVNPKLAAKKPNISRGTTKKPVAKPAAKPAGPGPMTAPVPGIDTKSKYGTNTVVQGGDVSLLGPLNIPKTYTANSTFLWNLDSSGNQESPAQHPGFNTGDEGRQDQSASYMTLAGGISYLRNLAANPATVDDYNAIVHALVAAQYLTPAQARYGSYTMQVGNKFLQSAADLIAMNKDKTLGGVITWWNHMDALANGQQQAGLTDANGLSAGGGSGSTPTRTDVYTNPEDVKAAVNNAAQSVLGRNLTDAEVAQFAGAFHGTEKTYNDQAWAQQQASANNAASAPDAVRAPSVSAAAQNYAQSSPALADDRTRQQLASYVQILRQMMGVPNSSGGVQNAYA